MQEVGSIKREYDILSMIKRLLTPHSTNDSLSTLKVHINFCEERIKWEYVWLTRAQILETPNNVKKKVS